MKKQTEDLRIKEIREVSTPLQVHDELPITPKAAATVEQTRHAIHDILARKDKRLIVVIGPCSIHDPKAAKEYAARLNILREELAQDLLIVMRVYFEKPRTTVGWKGLINDPDLDDSYEINKGLRLARDLLLSINEMGMPAGTEFLDLITPQYVADLVSWGAIGARTTESQVHRELASGLSCPVGFKNGTDGTLKIAVDAVRAANRPHCFLSMTMAGHSAIFTTEGNEDCHIILRGGKEPNYGPDSIAAARDELVAAKLAPNVMVDFSHANSRKQYQRQMQVGEEVAKQIEEGESTIVGVMIESHLNPGRQDIVAGKPLVYGQSITDGCIGWDDSVEILHTLAKASAARRKADQ